MHYGYIFVDPDHPDGPQVEVIPVRAGEFHLNVLKLLELTPCDDCFKVVGIDYPEPDLLDLDIRIDHPMPDLDYSAFDMRAIIMFNGSREFPTSGLNISDPVLGDGAVLNPDGYTALYNWSTIGAPVGEYDSYFKGNFATWTVPDSDINGYKYFTSDDPSNNRNAFYAGSYDVQSFSLQLPANTYVIGYAVDASWWIPVSTPVEDPLTDFDVNANCTEPWKVVVTEEPIDFGLTYEGGQTKLLIDVYDWQGKSTYHEPVIECPEIFDGTLTATWVSDTPDCSRYEVTISNDNLASVGNYICLVGVEAIENSPTETPWLNLTAYQLIDLSVISGGNLIWARRAGGSGSDYAYSIASFPDDSTVVTGNFGTAATFGPGDPNETILQSAGGNDIFIARYNPDGSLAWAKQAGGTGGNYGQSITVLPDNSIAVTGYFYSTATFGQDELNETILQSEGDWDFFIARYNPDGSLLWASQAGGTNMMEAGQGITSLSDNTTVVTGSIGGWAKSGSAVFGKGEPNETILPYTDYGDFFIARYNTDGTLIWAKQARSTFAAWGYGVATLPDDSLVVTGGFIHTATFGKGEPNETILDSTGGCNIFVARYNPDGSLQWAKQAGGFDTDRGRDITTLPDGSIAVTGDFEYNATFGKGEPNETVLNSMVWDESGIFIAKYNLDGTLVWVKQAGGPDVDGGSCINALSDNSYIISGYFTGTATFGPGEINEINLTSGGDEDAFIAQYNSDGSLAWANQILGSREVEGKGITALSDDSFVLAGIFADPTIFGPGEINETVLDSDGYFDMFIARFEP